jgi:hypothetical protein
VRFSRPVPPESVFGIGNVAIVAVGFKLVIQVVEADVNSAVAVCDGYLAEPGLYTVDAYRTIACIEIEAS